MVHMPKPAKADAAPRLRIASCGRYGFLPSDASFWPDTMLSNSHVSVLDPEAWMVLGSHTVSSCCRRLHSLSRLEQDDEHLTAHP